MEVVEVSEVMRCVLLCLIEVVEAPEAMRCVLLCVLDVLEMLNVLDVLEAMRCVRPSISLHVVCVRCALFLVCLFVCSMCAVYSSLGTWRHAEV